MTEKEFKKMKLEDLSAKHLANKFKVSETTARRVNRNADFSSYQREIWQDTEKRRLRREKAKSDLELKKKLEKAQKRNRFLEKERDKQLTDFLEETKKPSIFQTIRSLLRRSK